MKRLPWRQFRQSLESDLGSSDEGHWGPDEGPRQLPPPSAVAPVPWSLEVGRNCFWKGRVVASLLTMTRRWRSHRRSQRSPTHPSSGASPLRARARAQLQKEQTFARSACFLHPLAWSTCTQERTAGSPGQLQDYTDPARGPQPMGRPGSLGPTDPTAGPSTAQSDKWWVSWWVSSSVVFASCK